MTLDAATRDRYRPGTPAERRPAIFELLAQGLKPLDVATCLRVALAEVLEAAKGGPA